MSEAVKSAAKFLKSTLRLPNSTFPPRPLPTDIAKYLPRCTDDLYAWQRRERPVSDTFLLHDGPPYANGDLHAGHALNKVIKDIICRTQLANGKRIDYVPGWDCHGLPIELKALEQYGAQNREDVPATSIRKSARAFAQKAVKSQMKKFRSWAIMADWEKHWKTMDKDFELRQLSVFKAMAMNGLIYRKHKPVYWSPSSRTALAEAELEYKDDHVSTSALVKFPLFDSNLAGSLPVYVLTWTTTPWTLPANEAIAINQDLQYSIVKSQQHGLLVVARARIPYVQTLLQESLDIVQEELPVHQLMQATYSGPERFGHASARRPVIHAGFVSAESGTGLVHCAPGHGLEDYEALQPHIEAGKVNVRAPVDDGGKFTDEAVQDSEHLVGLDVFVEGTSRVVDLLKSEGLVLATHEYKHKYPIDWRTKKPIIVRATAQWFADVSSIKQSALQAMDEVRFLPDSGHSRLRSFVMNRNEWCISRQRAWGVPIPAIYHRRTGEPVLSEASISHIIETIRQRGIDAWWSDEADEHAWVEPSLPAADYVRGTDTMDVWFDSGSSWTSMQQDQDRVRADVYLEGSDQHRGWFQSSLLTSIAHQRTVEGDSAPQAPFRNLITHGFTLDGQGKKMSKSLGNVVAPDQLIDGLESGLLGARAKESSKGKQMHSLGPDALRVWVASSDWTKDVVISSTGVKTVHTSLSKWRVTMRLLLGLLADYDIRHEVDYEELYQLDRLALVQLCQITAIVEKAYLDFEFHKAISAINRWVAVNLSGFYFEATKDIMYCASPQSLRRRSAHTALYHILVQFQNMLAPVTPLLVEESWHHSSDGLKEACQYPFHRVWSTRPQYWNGVDLANDLEHVMAINSEVKAAQEEARTAKLLGQSLQSDVTILEHSDSDLYSTIAPETWREALVVSNVSFARTEKLETEAAELVQRKLTHAEGSENASWAYSRKVPGGIVIVSAPEKHKCARCWRYLVNESQKAREEELPLCNRCEDVVSGYARLT